MKNFWAILLGTALGGIGVRAELVDAIRVVVHDSVVTSQEVEIPVRALAGDLRRKYANNPEGFEKEFGKLLQDNTDQLVEWHLILHEFATAGYSFPETAVEEQVQERIRKEFLGDRSRLIKTLQSEGMTYERFRQQTRERMMFRVMTEKNVNREILISPHKVETYYLAHKEEYKVEEQVKLRLIVLKVPVAADVPAKKRLAEEIITSIKGGTAFAEMADVHSDEKTPPGGDRGWIQKFSPNGDLVLRQELADVAFTLKPGELSGVVETPGALWILLVEDKKPSHLKSLTEVREQIENEMVGQERNRIRQDWIKRLTKKTFVRSF